MVPWYFPYEMMPFKINILYPSSRQLMNLTVVPTNPISTIVNAVGAQYYLIYKGSILLPSFPFNFYNISDGECLVAVPKINGNLINFYKKNTLINPNFLLPLTGVNAVDNEREKVKMLDNSQIFVDLKPKAYRKAFKKYNEIMEKKLNKPLKPSETIYFKPDKPCSDPLPPFWK